MKRKKQKQYDEFEIDDEASLMLGAYSTGQKTGKVTTKQIGFVRKKDKPKEKGK